jgi:hypothetical protein
VTVMGMDRTARPKAIAHLVDWVRWPTGVVPDQYNDCRTTCTCGWEGTVGEWSAHRAAAGVPARHYAQAWR